MYKVTTSGSSTSHVCSPIITLTIDPSYLELTDPKILIVSSYSSNFNKTNKTSFTLRAQTYRSDIDNYSLLGTSDSSSVMMGKNCLFYFINNFISNMIFNNSSKFILNGFRGVLDISGSILQILFCNAVCLCSKRTNSMKIP